MLKYATMEILDARMGQSNVVLRTAHRAVFDYIPREGYLYVRSRAISSRCNDNYDYFDADEIKGNGSTTGYKTFVGKPVFVNHHNEDHRRARGVIIDAVLHEDHNADGSPDTWAEVLMEVDAVRFPKLAKAILAGHIDRTSMGVDVERSVCSVCANVAQTPSDYCRHIPGQKGKRYQTVDYKTGAKHINFIYEKCAGLKFFENSLLVEEPADPTAVTLDRPVLGPGLEHLLPRTASSNGSYYGSRNPKNFSNLIQDHQADALIMRKVKASDMSDDELQASKIHKTVQDGLQARTRTTGVVDPRIFDVPENAMPGLPRYTSAGVCPACRGTDTLRVEATRECVDCGNLWMVAVVDPEKLIAQGAGPRYPDPSQHPWFQANPVHHSNIVDMWNKATPDEKASGRRWYPDAQLVAQSLGKLHPDHPLNSGTKAQKHAYVDHPEETDAAHTHMAAGVLATYSPQSPWTTNMHNAARALHEGKGIGGKGSGVMASQQQANSADRIMSGERYTDVLKGPKVSDFAHLIEHGGDEKPDEPHVVIDRHALSVATGKRMSEEDYNGFPKSQQHYYGHVVDAYKRAADEIGKKSGETLHGHQVQAATWLAQQRHNQAGEKAVQGQDSNVDRLNKGRERSRQRAEQGWSQFKQEHGLTIGGEPGTGYVASRRSGTFLGNAQILTSATRRTAYGEQKAPADVDTLRDESCPICGESSAAYDGTNCGVCGWEAPPKMFADPDLEMAKQVDLRKDVLDPTGQDGTGVGDFADESAGGLEVGEDQPDLVCDNCGTTFDAGQPQTTDTADPEAGDRGDGPAEGDVCPVCGAGELVPPDVLDGEGGEGNPQDGLDVGGTDDVDAQGGDPNALDPSGFEQNPDAQDEEENPDDAEEDEQSAGPFAQRGDGPDDDESDEDDGTDEDDEDDENGPPQGKARAQTKHSLRQRVFGRGNR